MRNYPCRQPLASSSLLPASSSPPPASSSTPSALGFLLPASCTPLQTLRFLLYALSVQFSTHASNSPLPALRSLLPALLHSASDFLPPALSASTLYSLRPLLSAICFLLPASCFLRTLPLPFTLYSLLTASALSALCPQLSAFRSLPFNIGTLRKMVFREVVSMGSEPQLFHTSKKRVRSATSRRTPTLSVCYQLAFFTPGIRPFEAISRNWIRLMPN